MPCLMVSKSAIVFFYKALLGSASAVLTHYAHALVHILAFIE